jgi:hypothetical protein
MEPLSFVLGMFAGAAGLVLYCCLVVAGERR